MTKIWQIIKHEYRRHVFQKKFILSLLSLPIGVGAMAIVAVLIAILSTNSSPVGVVDQANFLQEFPQEKQDGTIFEPAIDFLSYQDADQAQTALDGGDIQAYYVIPETYPDSLEIELVYDEKPDSGVQNQFTQLLKLNLDLTKNLDANIRHRLQSGSNITITSLDGSREMNEDEWYLVFTPFVAGTMFVIVVMTSGGYLLQAVVQEKENRTMEIVITSVSPSQLMTGKIIGNIAVGLTQLIIWLIFSWIALKVGGLIWPVLQDFSLPADYILVLLLVLLPAFVMVAAIMASIGASMTEAQEAQQVSGLFSLPIMIPYYLSSVIMTNPNGTLAVVLSYIPLTAPITILMRIAFTVVPVWQIVINIAILVIFAALAIWVAGRTFRMGMLRYGKRISLKEIIGNRVEL